MKKFSFIAVDLQNDFTSEGGKHLKVKRPSIDFLKNNVFPFFARKNIKVNEIVSDYRAPRPGDRGVGCEPGTWGYESIVPSEIVKSQWIKCMNSPIWTRENIGNPDKEPGLPYQDTKAFGKWLEENVGKPEEVTPIVFGITIDCCVLSTLQELNWRGYYPKVIYEGTDHYDGTKESKDAVIKSTLTNRAEVVHWDELSSAEA